MEIFIAILLIAILISIWLVLILLRTDVDFIMERFRQIEKKIDDLNSL
jgi:hypothetical protein